jgi:N6-adenosine-specific RNA methylase IME4
MTLPSGIYRCIVADPPWPQPLTGASKKRENRAMAIPYQIANLGEIKALPVESIADVGSHLWLWTTNAFLRQAFDVMEAWGFTYLTTITWVKPSGLGAWFVGTTQHCLFGYYKRCEFKRLRYLPTHFEAIPPEHSAKPGEFYTLVRKVSCEPRIDLFNRRIITGFNGWGDESPYNENARGQVDLFGGVSK